MLTDTCRVIRALVRARWSTMLQLSTIATDVGGLSAVFAAVTGLASLLPALASRRLTPAAVLHED